MATANKKFRNNQSFMALCKSIGATTVKGGANDKGNNSCFFFASREEAVEGSDPLVACYLSPSGRELVDQQNWSELQYCEVLGDNEEWIPTICPKGDGNVTKNLKDTFLYDIK